MKDCYKPVKEIECSRQRQEIIEYINRQRGKEQTYFEESVAFFIRLPRASETPKLRHHVCSSDIF